MKHIDSTHDTLSHIKGTGQLNTDIEFDLKTEFFSFFGFKTSYSKYFHTDTVKILTTCADRKEARRKLLHYVQYFVIAEQIETGIFEFTLEIVTANNIIPHLAVNIYEEKLNDICKNLDINDGKIQNKTLLPSVMCMGIDPFIIAWFTPHQLHPKRWEELIQKQEDAKIMKDNIITSDLYLCYKCNGRKCTTAQIQTRGADEPMTIIVTCKICYTVVTINS
jgi:DNA-directed RNA polymerase subunit M/transcription elongation factor TFIIS